MALAANALTSVEAFERWLDVPIEDAAKRALVEGLIGAVSTQIEAWCRRAGFLSATVTAEALDGNDSRLVRVRRPPITALTAVSLSDAGTTTALAASEYTWKPSGWVFLGAGVGANPFTAARGVFPAGRGNVLVSYVGGYATVPEDLELAAIYAVGHHWYGTPADPSAASHSAGGASRTRQVSPSGLPPDARALLGKYRLSLTRTYFGRAGDTAD